ncbi:MAG: hypothetical protein K9K86_04260 [Pseudomonadales bacterium]|nr:hypothetical protein [Pseudomonadales bacterium]
MKQRQLLCLLVGLIYLLNVYAEENGSPKVLTKPEASQSEPEPVISTQSTAEKQKKETPDTFIPSEDISEDLSVSYPVDI